MKLQQADALYRKIDALDAMITDKSTTQGEKENAATLKKKIETKLTSLFPGARRPAPKAASASRSYANNNDFWTGMAKAAKDAQDLEDLKKNDPDAYRRKMEDILKSMKSRLAAMRRNHLSGNVETAYAIQQYAAKLERFMAREFPEMYAELLKKREEANYKAYQARDKKKAAKEKSAKDAVKKSGKLTWKEQGKTYEAAWKALYDQLVGLTCKMHGYKTTIGEGVMKWKNGPEFMMRVIYLPMGEVRKAWNKLSSERQQELYTAVEGINTMGYNQKGYTEAQKKALLNAMAPYKNPK